MSGYDLVLGALGVWRLTHLLHAENGPYGMLAGMRRVSRRHPVGQAVDCFYCLSLWIAAPAAGLIGGAWKERFLLWPAFSAAAILLERVSAPKPPAPVFYQEDPMIPQGESNHVQLRP